MQQALHRRNDFFFLAAFLVTIILLRKFWWWGFLFYLFQIPLSFFNASIYDLLVLSLPPSLNTMIILRSVCVISINVFRMLLFMCFSTDNNIIFFIFTKCCHVEHVFSKQFIVKNFKHTADWKKFSVKYLCNYYLDFTINILLHLLCHSSFHVFIFLPTH